MLCVIVIYSKFPWVIPLKDKKGIKITNAFQKVLDESNRKPNKIWADKGSQYCKQSMKVWLEKNGIEMDSAHNERKSVVTERNIRIILLLVCSLYFLKDILNDNISLTSW